MHENDKNLNSPSKSVHSIYQAEILTRNAVLFLPKFHDRFVGCAPPPIYISCVINHLIVSLKILK